MQRSQTMRWPQSRRRPCPALTRGSPVGRAARPRRTTTSVRGPHPHRPHRQRIEHARHRTLPPPRHRPPIPRAPGTPTRSLRPPRLPEHQEPARAHRIHWIHGGRTDLSNLALLCERHHVGHHAGEFEIVPDGTGGFAFISADGRNLSTPQQRLANAHPGHWKTNTQISHPTRLPPDGTDNDSTATTRSASSPNADKPPADTATLGV